MCFTAVRGASAESARRLRALAGSLTALAVTGGIVLLLDSASWVQIGRQRLQARSLSAASREQPVRTEAVRLLERVGAIRRPFVPRLSEIASNNQTAPPESAGSVHDWLSDPAADAPDWIELHNPHDRPVSLQGLTLTDDPATPAKWALPAATLQPGAFVMVWASGRDQPEQWQANFRIRAPGEYVGLYDARGFKCDSVQVPELAVNYSWARRGDDPSSWGASARPTPGGANVVPREHSGVVRFSHRPGFYDAGFELELRGPQGMTILYTREGATPLPEQAAVYRAAIPIDRTTVIQARAVDASGSVGPVSGQTFLFEQRPSIAVLCVIIDPQHLYGDESGIFANWKTKTIEHPVEFEFMDPATGGLFQAHCGMCMVGGITRKLAKKSFKLVAREIFGPASFDYPFFEDLPYARYDGLFVRSDTLSGMLYRNIEEQDKAGGARRQVGERIMNELVYAINQLAGGRVDMQAYEPAEVYLNGAYWGLYNLMETKGRHFIERHHGEREIDLLAYEDATVVDGSSEQYDELLDFINHRDLTTSVSFEEINRRIDVSNFIDFWIFQFYISNFDYEWNIRYWRPRTSQGKWRWIGYDYDDWNSWDTGMLEELMEEAIDPEDEAEGIYIFHKLCENPQFRGLLIQRMCHLLNTVLRPENVIALIENIDARVRDEKARDRARWSDQMDYEHPGEQVAHWKEYARRHPAVMYRELIDRFGRENVPVVAPEVRRTWRE